MEHETKDGLLLQFRKDSWRTDFLGYALDTYGEPGQVILDVGAGESQYRPMATGRGLVYKSQDFAQYVPDPQHAGLQDKTWSYGPLDYVCDIVDLPADIQTDIAMCTDVLEHVPDPVAAFKAIVGATKIGGRIVVSVPLLSITHQAPYWFQPGLSPYWFEHWSKELNLNIEHLEVQGDYFDWLSEEIFRSLSPRVSTRVLAGLVNRVLKRTKRRFSDQLLASAGLGVTFIATKNA